MTGKSIFNLLIAVVVIILLYFGYHLLRGNSAPAAGNGEATLSAAGYANGLAGANPEDEFLTTLNGLQELNLKGEIFGNPVFKSLVESPLVLPEETPGRPNPFAPVNFANFSTGNHATAAATSTTASSTKLH